MALSNNYSHRDRTAFARIKDGTYFQGQRANDVVRMLTYSLVRRATDMHDRGMIMDGSKFQSGLEKYNLALQDLLKKARRIPGLLPSTSPSDDEVIQFLDCVQREYPGDIENSEKELWPEDDAIILKLRCIGELVYGCPVPGTEPLIDRMAALENGTSTSGVVPAIEQAEEVTSVENPDTTTMQNGQANVSKRLEEIAIVQRMLLATVILLLSYILVC